MTSLVVEALRPHMVRSLFGIREPALHTIDDILSKKGFYPSYDGVSVWTFDFTEPESVGMFLAGDCTRFAIAAFQTFAEVPQDLKHCDRLPWAMVRAYYAAFYAAHAISRILGATCTYMEGPRVTMLRKVLLLYGCSFPFPGGLYWTNVSKQGCAIDLCCLSSQGGGTHELFWQQFSRLVQNLEPLVLNATVSNPQTAWDCLSTFRSVLTRSSSRKDSWLSNVRNDIQYKHSRGVWFHSSELSQNDHDAMSQIAARWRSAPDDLHLENDRCGDLSVFLSACTFLVGLCRAMVVTVEKHGGSGARRSFASHGPMRFIKERKL